MTTAMIAPTGSTSTPSHLSTDRTFASGAMKSRIGRTTVGPETIRIAPIRTAISRGDVEQQCRPKSTPSSHVIDHAEGQQPDHRRPHTGAEFLSPEAERALEKDDADRDLDDRRERVAEQGRRVDQSGDRDSGEDADDQQRDDRRYADP